MWMWVRSEQRRRWASLVGLAAVIAVGAGATLALAAGAHRADTVYERFAARTGAATIVMSEPDGTLPTTAAEANRHLEVLDRVRSIDGVEAVQVVAWFAASSVLDDRTPNNQGLVLAFSQGFAYFDRAHPPFLVVAGKLPAADDPEGVVVNEAAASEAGLGIGTTVDLETASMSRFAEWTNSDGMVSSYDGPRVHTVVEAIGRSFNELIDPGGPFIALMPGVIAAMGDSVVNCACFVGVRIRSGHVDEVRAQLEEIYRPYGLVARPGDQKSVVTSSIRVEVTTLWIAAFVAAAAALLVVGQFIARSASSMAARNDARRALGMVRMQRAGSVAVVLAPAVLTGAVVGGFIAYLLSGLFPRGLALRAEPDPGRRLDPAVLWLGGIGLLVALVLLVAIVAWRTAGLAKPKSQKPVRAITRLFAGDPRRALGTSFALDPSGGRPTPVLALTTLLGVAMASGGIVAVTTILQSRDDARSDRQIYGAPADYWFDDNGVSGAPGAIEFAQGLSDVTAITRTISIDDATSSATGPTGREEQVEPTAYERLRGDALPTLTNGSMPRGGDEVTLGAGTARALGVGIGDAVFIGDLSGSTHTFRVVGLVVSWDGQDPGHAFIVSRDALFGLLCADGVESGCNLRVSVWADPSDTAGAEALMSAGFFRVPPPANLDRLQQVGNIPWYLAGVLGVLGLAGLGHSLTTALRRRRSDLAIGRALGWTPAQSAQVLIWQAALTSLTGGVLGAALGLVVGRVLWGVIARGLDIVLKPATPLAIAALTIAGLVGASVLLALPVCLWARRLRTAEILRTD